MCCFSQRRPGTADAYHGRWLALVISLRDDDGAVDRPRGVNCPSGDSREVEVATQDRGLSGCDVNSSQAERCKVALD